MEQDIYEELKSIKQYLLLGAKSALNMDTYRVVKISLILSRQ